MNRTDGAVLAVALGQIDREDANLYRARQMLQVLSDLCKPLEAGQPRIEISRDALYEFTRMIAELLPDR